MVRKRSSLLRKISAVEFARRLRSAACDSEKRFAFFLGAGCSVTSGIPAAGQLVRNLAGPNDWLRRLRDVRSPGTKDIDLDNWASKELTNWDPKIPAASYGEMIDLLFLHDGDRQREIESICNACIAFPGFGYAILSRLMIWEGNRSTRGGQFNVAITTNFDDLLVDAFFYFQQQRPLVIHHDSLAPFIRPTRMKPMVIKLHGDHQLAPRNRDIETEALNELIRERTSGVLHDRGLIFLGYGGSDESIMAMLRQLPDESLPFGVYWVSKKEPSGNIRHFLEDREAIWVDHRDFDELMLLIMKEFEISDPDQSQFRMVHDAYQAKKGELLLRIENGPKDETGKALQHAMAWAKTWRIADNNPENAQKNFERLLVKYPSEVGIVGDFASFMTDIRGDHDQAQKFYEMAINCAPNHANLLGNFAIFLTEIRGDHQRAQELFERAIAADPNDAKILTNFALFMTNIRNDHDRAQVLFEKSIEADPSHANNLASFAMFMSDIRDDRDRALVLFEKAIDADPNHANNLRNFANFMADVCMNHHRAQELFERAIEVAPNHANILRNFALFLTEIRGDHQRAQELFKRATQAEQSESKASERFVSEKDGIPDSTLDSRQKMAIPVLFRTMAIVHRAEKTKFIERYKDDDQIKLQQVPVQEMAATRISRFAFELASESTSQGIARMALDTIIEYTDSDGGAILTIPSNYTIPTDPFCMQILAWHSSILPEYQRPSSFLCETVIDSGEAVLARDVDDDSALGLRDDDGRIAATGVICAPIRVNQNVIGLVHIYSTRKTVLLDTDDFDFTLAVTETIGMAMQNCEDQEALTNYLTKSRDEINQLKNEIRKRDIRCVEAFRNGSLLTPTSLNGALDLQCLKLNQRTLNVLKGNNINSLEYLIEQSSEDLLKFHGLGEKMLEEIVSSLERNGYHLSGTTK